MRRFKACLCLIGPLVLVALAPRAARAEGPPRFEFQKNDRVVLVGDTLIERAQRYGHLESLLTARMPDKKLTFRNLGWSGDTVFGLSRAGFDPPAEGHKRLVEQIRAAEPTVVIIGYGMADSFDGTAGLAAFEHGLNELLDLVAGLHARAVLLSPIAHKALGDDWPDPTRHNANLAEYTRAIERIAHERKALFIDLFGPTQEKYREANITDNGIHLNDAGYRFLAETIARGLGLKDQTNAAIELSADGKAVNATRPTLAPLVVQAKGLSPGRYALKVDGHRVTARPAEDWAKGVEIASGPDFDRFEQLRQTALRKNQLFFYRWRPQNITYLFGFRKHEQGNNAVEVPRFDPLVAEKEREIARLARPVPRQYELVREESEVGR